MRATYFKTATEFRAWLEEHSSACTELWVGYHKTHTGKASMTWPESVDQALCFGWIDGLRKRVDDARYVIRFSPRKAGSIWSSVNIARVAILEAQGLMLPPGLAAFHKRRENRSGVYSYERRPSRLPAQYAAMLKKNAPAHDFFAAQPASYRRAAIWWVVSAKKNETRERRLKQLIDDSARRRRIKQFAAPAPKQR